MEAQNIKKDNLIEVFGSFDTVDKVMNGELKINSQQALALGKLLNIDSSVFLYD